MEKANPIGKDKNTKKNDAECYTEKEELTKANPTATRPGQQCQDQRKRWDVAQRTYTVKECREREIEDFPQIIDLPASLTGITPPRRSVIPSGSFATSGNTKYKIQNTSAVARPKTFFRGKKSLLKNRVL